MIFMPQVTKSTNAAGDSAYRCDTPRKRGRGAARFGAVSRRGIAMGPFTARAALIAGAAAIFSAAPAHAELVNANNPATIEAIVESQGWPATIVTKPGDDPYIESNRNGLKFLVLFMNCEDGKNCKTLQYYMGFSDAKDVSLEKLNQWNKDKRFARAYKDDAGDPVLEMDVDLDFAGIPRENVGETFNTWASLMDSFREYVFEK
jgi:hypothetical protein